MSRLKRFFETEAAGGIVLIIAAALALLLANLPLPAVHGLLHNDQAHFWINDGLMAVFFFLVGLEIKREMVEGALSSRKQAMLPVIAAISGMAVPALIYCLVNWSAPENLSGWAIPAATDIAFAMCVIVLAGKHVPVSLKILLLAIAVIDDLGAILIIAFFYGGGLQVMPLIAGIVIAALIYGLNVRGVKALWVYGVLAVALWYAVLLSGLHPTIAGVAAALLMPMNQELEHKIHPWVAFGIIPLFGLFNAGVPFEGLSLSHLAEPVTLGILLGLAVGKPLGIFSAVFLAVRLRLSPMPKSANWTQVAGMALLCGIGFTMSLFIGALAFATEEQQTAIRFGILCGSLVSALAGYAVLRLARR